MDVAMDISTLDTIRFTEALTISNAGISWTLLFGTYVYGTAKRLSILF